MSSDQATSADRQRQANRIEGQFDTLRDRVIAVGQSKKYSAEEVAAMQAEMTVLSNQYFDLTGLTLE